MELDSILNLEKLSNLSASTLVSAFDAKFRSYGSQAAAYASIAAAFLLNSPPKDPNAHLRPGHPEFIGPYLSESRKMYHEIMHPLDDSPVVVRKAYGGLAPVVPFRENVKPAA